MRTLKAKKMILSFANGKKVMKPRFCFYICEFHRSFQLSTLGSANGRLTTFAIGRSATFLRPRNHEELRGDFIRESSLTTGRTQGEDPLALSYVQVGQFSYSTNES